MALRVYWEDTDASGIVYYANYLRFAERARSDLLRLLGVNQQRLLEEQGLALAVRACALEYLRPARLDDEIEVHSSIAEMRGASLTARQVVRRGEEELVQADVRIACIDRAGRPRRLPAQVVAALRPVAGQ
ncbi:MAG: tol-pal system-associated acyl-CoA thioesterase [Alphaproteobacteria bacterium]|nr:tol-pal system-associated acyl-CoA thioesterase [Alphaproteobacteria bacterium]